MHHAEQSWIISFHCCFIFLRHVIILLWSQVMFGFKQLSDYDNRWGHALSGRWHHERTDTLSHNCRVQHKCPTSSIMALINAQHSKAWGLMTPPLTWAMTSRRVTCVTGAPCNNGLLRTLFWRALLLPAANRPGPSVEAHTEVLSAKDQLPASLQK